MPPAAPQEQEEQQSLLLALPEPLLLAVLQCLTAANNQCSLFSAARAHSRLHQAAVAALSSISAGGPEQEQPAAEVVAGVLLYLGKHGQHVSSLSLEGDEHLFYATHVPSTNLRELPSTLQLHSLELKYFELQLLPGNGSQGMLGHNGVSPLKQLRLERCRLQEDHKGLAAALAQLPPELQHLALMHVAHDDADRSPVTFPTSVLQGRQQLTHLELVGIDFPDGARASPSLQPLQALSRLVDLRLAASQDDPQALTASMLSGAAGLTRLELEYFDLEPGALAGKTQLQHLSLVHCEILGHHTWTALLLPQLAPLQQLTHLELTVMLAAAAPAAAYSALTASSSLRHLDISRCVLPAAVWQHVFPAGRQLPHLTSLEAAFARQQPSGPRGVIAVPEGSRLFSCCPGLQSLDVRGLSYNAKALASLGCLTGLHRLVVETEASTWEALREVCQLTGLRDLNVHAPMTADGLLLQMTQLRQLTRLAYKGPHNGNLLCFYHTAEDPGDVPVWHRVLHAHLNHRDPEVAQAAAAALAAAE